MIDYQRLARDLTDVMIDTLHRQEHGEEGASLAVLVGRYMNEPIFNRQVQRAVARALDAVRLAHNTSSG